MCGRFTIATRREKIESFLAGLKITEWRQPQYDVRPTQEVPTVLNTNPEELTWIAWGLSPAFGGKLRRSPLLINARAESLWEKQSFQKLFLQQRCIILADGFFEWQAIPGSRQKRQIHFTLPNDEPFCFAGLWDESDRQRCAIVTTAARGVVASVHERMPVLLPVSALSVWLSKDPLPGRMVGSLLASEPSNRLGMRSWKTLSDERPQQMELL